MNRRLITDTTEFCCIDYGDVILAGDKRYVVTGHERERRFGMDDPKFWVKRVEDEDTGEKKIVKLSFLESFEISLGGVRVRCFRNPDKEAQILNLVQGHPFFMQGRAFRDEKNNSVRVLDIVRGPNLLVYIESLSMGYERYFRELLPQILPKLLRAFDAIRFLHSRGYKHGDIRNDHLILDRDTGNAVWIDFDYDYDASENPFGLDLFGLGNILLCALGKGFHTLHMIRRDRFIYGDLIERLEPEDFSMLDPWRLMNLKKLYPCVPEGLNNILMHFSRGAEVFYEHVEEMTEELAVAMESLSGNPGGEP